MKQDAYAKTLEWLKTNPALDELCAKFPDEWATVQQEISAIVERGVAEDLKAYLERLSKPLPKAVRESQHKGSRAVAIRAQPHGARVGQETVPVRAGRGYRA